MGDLPVFEEVISSQTEVLEAEQRLHKLEAELGANPTEAQLAAVAGRGTPTRCSAATHWSRRCEACCSASASPSAT